MGWRVGQEVPALSQPISFLRRGAAFASMLGASSVIAYQSIHPWRIEWLGLAWAGMLAVGGLGITAKNLSLQTLSRGMAWLMAAPSAIAVGIIMLGHHGMDWPVVALLASSASALLLARPQLHTKEAFAQFHPHRFRRTFLAGSTATAATAFLTGGISLELLHERGLASGPVLGMGVLAATLLLVSTAVVRMRGWGIVLGAATSAVLLVIAAVMRHAEGTAIAMLALPMLLLHLLPILLARWIPAPASATSVRVAPSVASATLAVSAPVRYRIASREDEIDAAIDADREELPQEGCKVHV